jgi:DNA polymerase-1
LLDLSNYDGRIHGSIHVNGTATGRLSSTNPNLQNQPPEIAGVKIKAAFVPTDTSSSASEVEKLICKKYNWSENEEMCIVDMDFAGAEVRGLTTYAKDKSLLEALDSGLDMHSWVASMCFGETYEAINTARNVPKNLQTENDKRLTTLRKHAKAVVFGIIFCISAPKLANDLGITTDEAEKLMNTFFTRFPNIENYIRTTKEKVYSKGILRTPTGRARRFPLAAYGGSIGAACARQGVNFLVQGFTSEIVNRVLINCKSKFKSIRARMILTVHDSLVFEMPVSELNKLEAFLKENVRDFIKATFPQVPVEVPYDVEVGPSYGEAKSSISDYYAKKCNSVV